MKTTPVYALTGQQMVVTLDSRRGSYALAARNEAGQRMEIMQLHKGQQLFIMPSGDTWIEQSDDAEGAFNIVPVRDGGVIRGESAYQIAVRHGYDGTEAQWLESLKVKGAPGTNGVNGYGIAPGMFVWWPGHSSKIPAGWLLCNGSSHEISRYPDLYAAIGAKYGGSGNTFCVPNLQHGNGGRFIRALFDDHTPIFQDDAMRHLYGEASNFTTRGLITGGIFYSHMQNMDQVRGQSYIWKVETLGFDSRRILPNNTAHEIRPVNIAFFPLIKT